MAENTTEFVRAALEQARAAHPELATLLDLHAEIFAAQRAVQDALTVPAAAGDPTRLADGQPALTFDALAVDWGLFARLWQQCDEIARRYHADWPRQATPVAAPETVRGWFEGQAPADERVAFLDGAALTPFLWRAAESLAPHLNHDLWRRGQCPICGGAPDFAFLDTDSGARHLVCARCDSDWLYRRIGCPFCDNTDPERLSYFPSDDEVYRLYVCDACKRYLKAVDLRRARHRVVWGVERIATAGMDVAALGHGYRIAEDQSNGWHRDFSARV